MRDDTCASDRRVNLRIVLVDAIDGGILLTQVAHVVVSAKCYSLKVCRQQGPVLETEAWLELDLRFPQIGS